MTAEELRARTKQFTLRVLKVVAALPDNAQGRVISYQLMKSGSSVGANYRAVCRSRSTKDFVNKLGVVIEEADESAFWLEIICEGAVLDKRAVAPLLQEANELVTIFTAARKTARLNSRSKPKDQAVSSQSSITNLKSQIHSLRDFYAFEQHVKTCRGHRGLGMVPQWYEVPVFYFSNPVAIVGDDDAVWAPKGSAALDYELELACVIGKAARNLPADDSALECVAGFTVMNDWSARDIQRAEMAVGLGPSKSKDFATSLGPRLVPLTELGGAYRDGRLHLAMTAAVNGKQYSSGNAGSMYWTWPQLLAHASRDTELRPGDVLGSGTVGTGCILELTPEAVGGWLKPGDVVELTIDGIGTLRNTVVERPA